MIEKTHDSYRSEEPAVKKQKKVEERKEALVKLVTKLDIVLSPIGTVFGSFNNRIIHEENVDENEDENKLDFHGFDTKNGFRGVGKSTIVSQRIILSLLRTKIGATTLFASMSTVLMIILVK